MLRITNKNNKKNFTDKKSEKELILMADKQIAGESILLSHLKKIGIVHLQGIEKYIDRNRFKRCFLITPVTPHENVLSYAQKIPSLEIIVSHNFREEKRKITETYPEAKIITVDPYHLAGRDGMLDA